MIWTLWHAIQRSLGELFMSTTTLTQEEAYSIVLPFIIFNLVALYFMFVAMINTRSALKLYCILFGCSSLVNIYMGFTSAQSYYFYGKTAILPYYKHIILDEESFFHQNTQLCIVCLGFTQYLISCSFLLMDLMQEMRTPLPMKKFAIKFGTLGGIIFFGAVTPLGVGSAMPSTIIFAFGLIFILFNHKLVPIKPKRF